MAHPELGSRILDDVLTVVGDHVKVETQARLEGRNMSMVLAPDRKPLPKGPNDEPAGAPTVRRRPARGDRRRRTGLPTGNHATRLIDIHEHNLPEFTTCRR